MVLYRGIKDEFFGTLKEYIGWAIGNEKLETNGKKRSQLERLNWSHFVQRLLGVKEILKKNYGCHLMMYNRRRIK